MSWFGSWSITPNFGVSLQISRGFHSHGFFACRFYIYLVLRASIAGFHIFLVSIRRPYGSIIVGIIFSVLVGWWQGFASPASHSRHLPISPSNCFLAPYWSVCQNINQFCAITYPPSVRVPHFFSPVNNPGGFVRSVPVNWVLHWQMLNGLATSIWECFPRWLLAPLYRLLFLACLYMH